VSLYEIRLTKGHVLRHAPARSAQGAEAALIDIAQDLLLRELAPIGVLEMVAFKGGTAVRKVYAGAEGRFSTDLDFSVVRLADDPDVVKDLVVEAIDGRTIGPFRYSIEDRRGRAHIA
jgi:predicted nucleotidyltransferase component of viral defense system